MTDDSQTVAALTGFQRREIEALQTAGMRSLARLVMHLPRRHENRRRFPGFPNQASGDPVCLKAMVQDAGRRFIGKRGGYFEALLHDASGPLFDSAPITCRWFNMPFMHKVIAAGQELVVYGKVKDLKGRLIMDHPDFEVIQTEADDRDSIHLGRIVPIYPNVSGISQRRLREAIHAALAAVNPARLPWAYDANKSKLETLRRAHFPELEESRDQALRALALEEFFSIQLRVAWSRARLVSAHGFSQGRGTKLLTEFYQNLPFDLTESQKRSVREIIADMRAPRPMHRLLQGDVGAGKTLVAMCAMLLAVESGYQAALMAPTQILAEQHFLTFRKWLDPLGVRIRLITSARAEDSQIELAGEPQMLIGTHALLFDRAVFQNLGLVVVDEQHKFGVAQRAALTSRGTCPDLLVMTATPIPRTLTMTVHGDLDVSILDGKPAGRGVIQTAVRHSPNQRGLTKFVLKQLTEGRQAYLVYPLVSESETLKAESVEEAFPKWQKRLRGFEVGLLHGKLRAEEKENIMAQFREGKIHALVSTSVIEVGVDVANAAIMIIHSAERFGLAQLHQLRGRVGRGTRKSFCILLTKSDDPDAVAKLSILERTADGFEIAEEDLRLRGPGDVLGTMQSGMAEIRFPEFLADMGLLREARALADSVIETDPELSSVPAELRDWVLSSAEESKHWSHA